MNTLIDLFARQSKRLGSKPCVKLFDPHANQPDAVVFTYQQIYHTLVNNSRLFAEIYGLNKRDTVVIISDNSLEYLLLVYSAIFAGVKVLPISTKSPGEHIAYFIQESHSKHIFRSEKYADLCKKIFNDNELVGKIDCSISDLSAFSLHDCDTKINHQEVKHFAINHEIKGDDIAIILHTSGTTKTPKLVPLSHRTILNNQKAVHQSINKYWTENDGSLGWLPLFHGYALIAEFIRNIYTGATYTLFKHDGNPSATELIKAIEQSNVSILCCVPWMLRLIQERLGGERNSESEHSLEVLKKLSFIITGGAELNQRVGKFYDENKISIVSAFGLTEASGFVLFSDFEGNRRDSFTPIPDPRIVFSVIDKKGKSRDHELVLKMPGYVSEAVTSMEIDKKLLINKEQYFRTGDLFRKNNGGWIYSGRNDQIYNSLHGEKINPMHFESGLEKHGDVEKVFVFGENLPFNIAIVELKKNIKHDNITKESIHSYIQDNINPQLDMPARVYSNDIYFLPVDKEIPLTPKGSVNRGKARKIFKEYIDMKKREDDLYKAGEGIEISTIIITEVNRYLTKKNYIQEESDKSLLELGFDSLMLLSLKNSLEVKLNISIPVDSVLSFPSLISFINDIQKIKSEHGLSEKKKVQHSGKKITKDSWRNITLEQVLFHTAYYAFPFPAFNASMTLSVPGPVSHSLLVKGMRFLESKHDILRSIYRSDGTFKIVKSSFVKEASLGVCEVSGPHEIMINDEVQEIIRGYTNKPFDLDKGPPYAYALINIINETQETKSLIYLGMHHVIGDFMSINILIEDLQNFIEGKIEKKIVIKDKYQNAIPVVNSELISEYKKDWLKVLTAPDMDKNANLTKGSSHGFKFPDIKLDKVADLLGNQNISLFNGLFSVWILVASKHFGNLELEGFWSTTAITTRVSAAVEKLTGCFVQFPLLRFRLNKADMLKDLMRKVQLYNTMVFKEAINEPVKYLKSFIAENSNQPPMQTRNMFFYRAPDEMAEVPAGWTIYKNQLFIDRCELGVYFDVCASTTDHSMEGYIRIHHNYCDVEVVKLIMKDIEILMQNILTNPKLNFNPGSILHPA